MIGSKYGTIEGKEIERNFNNCLLPNFFKHGRLISVNEKFLAMSWENPGEIVVVDSSNPSQIKDDQIINKGPQSKINDLEFSPFINNILASAYDDNSVLLWKLSEGGNNKILNQIQCYKRHKKSVSFVSFNPVVEDLICSATHKGEIHVWNTIKGESYKELDLNKHTTSISWNPNGTLIGAITSFKFINIFDPRNNDNNIYEYQISESQIDSKFVWIDNTSFVSISSKENEGKMLKLWDIRRIQKDINSEGEIISKQIDTYKFSSITSPLINRELKLLYIVSNGEKNINIYDCSGGTFTKIKDFISREPSNITIIFNRKGLDYNKFEIDRLANYNKNKIYYISFKIPNTEFNEDFFPPIEYGESALTYEQWIKGETSEPIKKKINDFLKDKKEIKIKKNNENNKYELENNENNNNNLNKDNVINGKKINDFNEEFNNNKEEILNKSNGKNEELIDNSLENNEIEQSHENNNNQDILNINNNFKNYNINEEIISNIEEENIELKKQIEDKNNQIKKKDDLIKSQKEQIEQIQVKSYENKLEIENIIIDLDLQKEFELKKNTEKEEYNKVLNEKFEEKMKEINDKIFNKINEKIDEINENNIEKYKKKEKDIVEKINEFEKIINKYNIDKNEVNLNQNICNTIHNGIKCEKCFQEPIIGCRYKCSVCNNYNLCEKCEEKNYNLKEYKHEHNFIKIREEQKDDNKTMINEIHLNQEEENQNKKEEYSYECLNISQLSSCIYEGTSETKIEVIIKNNGKLTWPENESYLIFERNKKFIDLDEIKLQPQKPGEQKSYNAIFKKLERINPGEYELYLSLYVNNDSFGEKLKLKIIIKKNTEEMKEIDENKDKINEFRNKYNLPKEDFSDEKLLKALKSTGFSYEFAFDSLF